MTLRNLTNGEGVMEANEPVADAHHGFVAPEVKCKAVSPIVAAYIERHLKPAPDRGGDWYALLLQDEPK